MRFDMWPRVVVGTAIVVALGRTDGLPGAWADWRARRTIEEARTEEGRLRELESHALVEPRLAPVLSSARASIEARRHRLALEASELAFEGARGRFEASRREASEGQALIDSATDLLRERADGLSGAD